METFRARKMLFDALDAREISASEEKRSKVRVTSMANDLLTSFNTASRSCNHVVFNEKTQEFEKAGKRHAIATFFGLPDAKAKNNLTLLKIKEALAFEVSQGGRFSGYGEITDGLFRNVDGDRRIKSSTVNAIIDAFRKEAMSAPGMLKDMKAAAAKKILDGGGDIALPGLPDGCEGGRTVFEMMVRHLIDDNLADVSVASSIEELRRVADHPDHTGTAKAVRTGLENFLAAVGNDPQAKESFIDIFGLVDERSSDRFSRMAGCELARIAVALDRDSSLDVRGELGRLSEVLRNPDSARSALVEADSIPIRIDSYDLALEVARWDKASKTECLNLLAQQPVDSRVPLLAAMEAFGASRDVFLLQRLAGVQEAIKELHAYGNLTPENIYRAIEGDFAQIPQCVANGDVQEMSGYFGRAAFAELEDAISQKDWSPEKRDFARTEGLRLMRFHGASARDVVESISETESRFPVFTGARRNAVAGLRAALGDFFDNVEPGIKYNLLAVPEECRTPVIEAFKIATGGNPYDERLLHILVANRDGIAGLWNEGRLSKENVLRIVAAGSAGLPESVERMNPYSQILRPEFGCGMEKASARLAEHLKSEKEYLIVIDSPRFDPVSFHPKSGQGSAGRAEEVEVQCSDIGSILAMCCGEERGEQVAMAMYAMAQAARQVLLAHTIQNGVDGLPRSFSPVYTVSTAESGDLELRISNTPESDIALDWSITIHPDATHTATDPVIASK